jgi:hypothetical protein
MSISDIFTWLPSGGSAKDFADGYLQNFNCLDSDGPDNSLSGLSLSSYVLSDTSADNRDIMLTADNTTEVFFRGRGYSLSC